MPTRLRLLVGDIALFVVVLGHLLVTVSVFDAVTHDTVAKRWTSVWLFVVSSLVNLWSVSRSWMFLGTGNGPPETIIGIFFEVLNLNNAWGALYAMARLFSRDENVDVELFNQTLTEIELESLIEVSLLNAGVGFVRLTPETGLELAATWVVACIGGVLVTSMFLLSVVLSRRGFWERLPPKETTSDNTPSTAEMTFTLQRALDTRRLALR